jgi:hypothetical protein
MAGSAGIDVSEIDLNPQFHPNLDFDLDIFSNKKRIIKNNIDVLASDAQTARAVDAETSRALN